MLDRGWHEGEASLPLDGPHIDLLLGHCLTVSLAERRDLCISQWNANGPLPGKVLEHKARGLCRFQHQRAQECINIRACDSLKSDYNVLLQGICESSAPRCPPNTRKNASNIAHVTLPRPARKDSACSPVLQVPRWMQSQPFCG